MTPGIESPLKDTGEQVAQSSKSLKEKAETSASELFVEERCKECGVRRWIFNVKIWMAFTLGLIVAINASGVLLVRSFLKATVRDVVEQVLREKKLAVEAETPTTFGDPMYAARREDGQ